MPLLECRDLEFKYPNGVQALAGVSLEVEAGQSIAIVGRNGSGKTTLVKHFNGLLVPQQGSVSIEGSPILNRDPAELAPIVGLVFQNPSDQIFQGRVWDEIGFGVKQLGFTGKAFDDRVNAALAEIRLAWAKDANPYDLTLTERKLVCLASIIAMDPKIVILDEPTTAQDQLGVLRLVEIVHDLLKQNRTVITITHDMDFVAEAFDRTIVMREGRIILDGSTTEVFEQPQILETTYVKPSSMSRLAQRLNLSRDILTIKDMVEWMDAKRKVNGQSKRNDDTQN